MRAAGAKGNPSDGGGGGVRQGWDGFGAHRLCVP